MREQVWIKSALKMRGYKLRHAAERLNVSPPRMTDIIKGMREVQSDEVLPLSQMLGLSPTTLLKSLEAGALLPEPDSASTGRLPILGTLYGSGKLGPVPDTITFSSVPIPPDAFSPEGLSCYVVGDDAMSRDIPAHSLIIAADPKRHFFPITPGAIFIFTHAGGTFLRRYHRTREGDAWLIATPQEPDPRYASFILDLDPAAADDAAHESDTASGGGAHVGIDDIAAGVLWVHHQRIPKPAR